LGIVVSLKESYPKKSTVLTYILRINGLGQVEKIGKLFGSKWKEYEKIVNNYKRRILPIGYRKFTNYAVTKVIKIQKTPYEGEVYSVETENSLLVSSGGILIHNCFPKDIEAFIYISKKLGYDFGLLKEVKEINQEQRKYFVEKIKEHLWILKGKKIAILGLSFKPDTDDMRFSPSIDIINFLLEEGAHLSLYDPQAIKTAKEIFSSQKNKIKFFSDPYQAAKSTDCLCILTAWEEFKKLDFKKIKKLMHYPLIADGRNMLDKEKMISLGFEYIGIGR
jgi:UDPglucose 6-dehydrogenase